MEFKSLKIRFLSLILLSFFFLYNCRDSEVRIKTIQMKAIVLSDDDGSRGPDSLFTPPALDALVDSVNVLFSPAGLRFGFDPSSDWITLSDSTLNNLSNRQGNENTLQRADSVASRYPNKLVVFFRASRGNGFGNVPDIGQQFPEGWRDSNAPYISYRFVAMPNNWGQVVQGSANGNPAGEGNPARFFSHELGHHLGLFHTFPGRSNNYIYTSPDSWPTPRNAESSKNYLEEKLAEFIINNGGNVDDALNGDLLSDTPPDPGVRIYQAVFSDLCSGVNPSTGEDTTVINITGTLNSVDYDYTLQADRTNIMGYFGGCSNKHTFSQQQIARMIETLFHPTRFYLIDY